MKNRKATSADFKVRELLGRAILTAANSEIHAALGRTDRLGTLDRSETQGAGRDRMQIHATEDRILIQEIEGTRVIHEIGHSPAIQEIAEPNAIQENAADSVVHETNVEAKPLRPEN